MKFAHFADVHIGSWRDARLANVSTEGFKRAIDLCFQQGVDFILIAGDFFNTSLPSIDNLKDVVKKLREIKEKNIPVYVIAGSHDFSPTGKTMLDVLENAGLLVNVMRGSVEDGKLRLAFTVDKKTGAKITGVVGKKGMLERRFFDNLELSHLEKEEGVKIFMFHTAISEFKPEGLELMDATPLSAFPKNCTYYAGGHVHDPFKRGHPGYGVIAWPGPLFPNNFRELEKLGGGGFYLVEITDSVSVSFQPISIHNHTGIVIDCTNHSPKEVEEKIYAEIENKEFNNTIVTLRLYGRLRAGKISSINFKAIFDTFYSKSAHFVMKNTAKLTSPEFKEVKVSHDALEDLESSLIREHVGKIKVEGDEIALVRQLMKTLAAEKDEGETTQTFERRLKDDISRILKFEL